MSPYTTTAAGDNLRESKLEVQDSIYAFRDEIIVQEKLVFKCHRLVVPAVMWAHATHISIEDWERSARELVSSPEYRQSYISKCDICIVRHLVNSLRRCAMFAPLMNWPYFLFILFFFFAERENITPYTIIRQEKRPQQRSPSPSTQARKCCENASTSGMLLECWSM